jgi:hypothetical protein
VAIPLIEVVPDLDVASAEAKPREYSFRRRRDPYRSCMSPRASFFEAYATLRDHILDQAAMIPIKYAIAWTEISNAS